MSDEDRGFTALGKNIFVLAAVAYLVVVFVTVSIPTFEYVAAALMPSLGFFAAIIGVIAAVVTLGIADIIVEILYQKMLKNTYQKDKQCRALLGLQ